MSIEITANEPILSFISGQTLTEFRQQLDPDSRLFLQKRLNLVRLPAADQLFFAELPVWLHFLCLASDDSPDVFMVLPILQRIVDCNSRLDLRIINQDADLDNLGELLDDEIDLEADLADMDMPVLFILDEDWNQIAQWGPRPQAAEERLDAWLSKHPRYEELLNDEEIEESKELDRLMDELIQQMRCWYQDDLNVLAAKEIRNLIEQYLAEREADDAEK